MLRRITQFFTGRSTAAATPGNQGPKPAPKALAKGILVFAHTGDVIAAQRILESAGIKVAVKGPPPALRTGCDMVIEYPLVEALHVKNTLANGKVQPLDMVAVEGGLLEPVSLYHTKDFGQWLMVRAANMKITVDKETRVIVNISGGGCPDVPFLASLLTGKTLEQAPEPQEMGQTLCGYALQLAFAEMVRLCRG